ncbi:MAG: hypothetical protein ACJAQT_004059 [Akkermansiaceae bacterium]|jgi:hypothetical protein
MKFFAILLLLPFSLNAAEPLKLSLATDNRALFEGKPEDFYMFQYRYADGKTTEAWTGGQYGFVRDLIKTDREGVIATKFHEGLDIKPTKRDRTGNPLDEIRAIANGQVVYLSKNAGGSTYGKYIVIKHDWGYGPFFSLYAHLARVDVELEQRVLGGFPIAKMGYTGVGLNRTRAHLHLELCMLSTENFEDWIGTANPRGNYDGRNLIGLDIASLFLAAQANLDLTIPSFLESASPYFKVAIPRDGELEITKRYPWLKKGDHTKPSPSYELAFTDSGIPLSIVPSHRQVSKALLTYVRTTRSRHEHYTRGRLTGSGRRASLTKSGKKFIALFTNEYTKPKSPKDESDDS